MPNHHNKIDYNRVLFKVNLIIPNNQVISQEIRFSKTIIYSFNLAKNHSVFFQKCVVDNNNKS
jgi:hypothetical protein